MTNFLFLWLPVIYGVSIGLSYDLMMYVYRWDKQKIDDRHPYMNMERVIRMTSFIPFYNTYAALDSILPALRIWKIQRALKKLATNLKKKHPEDPNIDDLYRTVHDIVTKKEEVNHGQTRS